MELILLNIGRENHLIYPALFSILVLMTICTTVAASPIFNYLFREIREDFTTESENITVESKILASDKFIIK
jgi:Kef-type K+ transport system membrane component KefB